MRSVQFRLAILEEVIGERKECVLLPERVTCNVQPTRKEFAQNSAYRLERSLFYPIGIVDEHNERVTDLSEIVTLRLQAYPRDEGNEQKDYFHNARLMKGTAIFSAVTPLLPGIYKFHFSCALDGVAPLDFVLHADFQEPASEVRASVGASSSSPTRETAVEERPSPAAGELDTERSIHAERRTSRQLKSLPETEDRSSSPRESHATRQANAASISGAADDTEAPLLRRSSRLVLSASADDADALDASNGSDSGADSAAVSAGEKAFPATQSEKGDIRSYFKTNDRKSAGARAPSGEPSEILSGNGDSSASAVRRRSSRSRSLVLQKDSDGSATDRDPSVHAKASHDSRRPARNSSDATAASALRSPGDSGCATERREPPRQSSAKEAAVHEDRDTASKPPPSKSKKRLRDDHRSPDQPQKAARDCDHQVPHSGEDMDGFVSSFLQFPKHIHLNQRSRLDPPFFCPTKENPNAVVLAKAVSVKGPCLYVPLSSALLMALMRDRESIVPQLIAEFKQQCRSHRKIPHPPIRQRLQQPTVAQLLEQLRNRCAALNFSGDSLQKYLFFLQCSFELYFEDMLLYTEEKNAYSRSLDRTRERGQPFSNSFGAIYLLRLVVFLIITIGSENARARDSEHVDSEHIPQKQTRVSEDATTPGTPIGQRTRRSMVVEDDTESRHAAQPYARCDDTEVQALQLLLLETVAMLDEQAHALFL